ncbi:MAG TPA: M48 family metallopeptidase [Candidatus Paceibacterota bacterium]|nr:M48 family metallopeptidase [Candidatus Paceibacterota bacterium]
MHLKRFLLSLKRKRVTKKRQPNKHYETHKEIARTILKEHLEHFAPLCEVTFKRVAIRNQKRRWGSCTSRGNLNFSYRLVFLPKELCDYVVVHELCHLKQMNHGPAFWAEVAKVLPNYETLIIKLRALEKTLNHRRAITADPHSYWADYSSKLEVAE